MAQFQDAYQLFEREDYAQAIVLLEQLIEDDPNQINVRYLQGVCHFRLGEFGKAEGAFRCGLSINSDHVESLYYLGLCLERQQRLAEARKAYDGVLAFDPAHGMALKKTAQLRGSPQPLLKRPEGPLTTPLVPVREEQKPPSGAAPGPAGETRQPVRVKGKWRSARHPVGCFLATIRWVLLLGAGAGIGAVIGGSIAEEPGVIGGGIAGALVSQLIQVLTVKRER